MVFHFQMGKENAIVHMYAVKVIKRGKERTFPCRTPRAVLNMLEGALKANKEVIIFVNGPGVQPQSQTKRPEIETQSSPSRVRKTALPAGVVRSTKLDVG